MSAIEFLCSDPPRIRGLKCKQAGWDHIELQQKLENTVLLSTYPPRTEYEVHVDQIKPCFSISQFNESYPMAYRSGEILGLLPQDNVKTVLQYKNTDEGLHFFNRMD